MTKRLTIKEAITYLRLSEKTIRRHIKSGQLNAEKQGNQWFILVNDDPNHGHGGQKQGQTYKISFMAKSEDGNGQIKVMLKEAKKLDLIYDSQPINIGSEPKTYTKTYTHNAENKMDVRLEFDVGSKKQVLYIDKVALIRN